MQVQGLSDLTVLVADDGEISRRMAAATLKQIGVQRVVQVANGQAVLDHIANPDENVDLVIADVRMPGIDGFALAEKIKDGGGADAPPVILLTATVDHNSSASESNGVAAVLAKPATVDILRGAIVSALS